MPRVTEQYRAARRAEILAAATRAFHRGGFQGTSMAEIIAESGLSAGAIYGHFPSKAALIQAVAREVIGARVGELERALRADPMPPPPTLVRVFMRGMLRDVGQPAILVQLWGEAVSEPDVLALVREVFSALQQGWLAYLAQWRERIHGDDPEEAARIAAAQLPLFLSAAQGFIMQSALMPEFDADRYFAAVEEYLPQ